jgi:hypothetical protein
MPRRTREQLLVRQGKAMIRQVTTAALMFGALSLHHLNEIARLLVR